MAIVPLFVADRATLVKKLRLTGALNNDVDAIIDEAIQKVRTFFFSELGEGTVNAVKAIPFVENATTSQQMLRTVANSCEVQWVKCLLITDLPVLFMEKSGQALDVWNSEGMISADSKKPHQAISTEVCNGVFPLLDQLKAMNLTANENAVNIMLFGNSAPCDPVPPGQVSPRTAKVPYGTLARPY